jgi:L-fuculose-phosphate aldolase
LGLEKLREEVVATAKELERRGLVERSSGNVSARAGDAVVITASGVPYSRMTPLDTVVLSLDGEKLEGEGAPSVETPMHLAVYRARRDAEAVIHSHPVWASAFAAARRPIPAFLDELGVYLGGGVEVAEYAVSGSPELAEACVRALGERAACLLANHGLLACGRDLEEALHVTSLVERAAQTLLGALALGGPAPLPEELASLYAGVYRYRHGLAGGGGP